MERMLMISGWDPDCGACGGGMQWFCPSCQYAYWSTRDESGNWDCPHSTGYSESQARAEEKWAEAVKAADAY